MSKSGKKIRVYELTRMMKDSNSNKETIEILKKEGIEVRSHNSTVSEEDVKKLAEKYMIEGYSNQEKQETKEEKEEPKPKARRARRRRKAISDAEKIVVVVSDDEKEKVENKIETEEIREEPKKEKIEKEEVLVENKEEKEQKEKVEKIEIEEKLQEDKSKEQEVIKEVSEENKVEEKVLIPEATVIKQKEKPKKKAKGKGARKEKNWRRQIDDWEVYLDDEKKIRSGQDLEDETDVLINDIRKEKEKVEKQKEVKKEEKSKKVDDEKKKQEEKEKEQAQKDKKKALSMRELLEKRRRQKRKRKLKRKQQQEELMEQEMEEEDEDIIEIPLRVSVGELAELLEVPRQDLYQKLFALGINDTLRKLEPEVIEILAEEYGKKVRIVEDVDAEEFEEMAEDEANLEERPPIVTIMGHVDHGKTTLLDYIRKTKVAAREAGGITQHIGAYQVTLENGKKITFIDTPGHEAFTKMRARGAKVTDIAVLIVAADDGVQPQTIEAIDHASAAGVPIIVAVNKIDKPGANPDRVKQQLADMGIVPEDWGGDVMFVNVSALTGQNVDELLESISVLAEIMELKANPKKKARGYVIESYLDRGRGPVATVIVKDGTLRVGDPIVIGTVSGKVRVMLDDKGQRVKEAPPAMPVEISGLEEVPEAGERFKVVGSEKEARKLAQERKEQLELLKTYSQKKVLTLEDLMKHLEESEKKELKLIVRADTDGTAIALRESLEKLSNEEVKVRVIRTAIGAITEADVDLAKASEAIIVGFNVRPQGRISKLAQNQGVQIRTYRVIYECIEDVKKALEGMLEPEEKEEVLGRAEVRQTFKVSGVGVIAGLHVTDGVIRRNAKVRVIRDGVVIYEGDVESLKRFKDDVTEVAKGYECGLKIANFNDIKVGDEIESFQIVKVKKTL